MDSDSRSYWIITVILIALAAIFALCETAISSVSQNRIKADAERGDTRAEKHCTCWNTLSPPSPRF